MDTAILSQILSDVTVQYAESKIEVHLRNLLNAMIDERDKGTLKKRKNWAEAYAKQIDGILAGFEKIDFTAYPPLWRNYLEELGLSALLNIGLRDSIDTIVDRNLGTPILALGELSESTETFLISLEISKGLLVELKRYRLIDLPAYDKPQLIISLEDKRLKNLTNFAEVIKDVEEALAITNRLVSQKAQESNFSKLVSSDPTMLVSINVDIAGILAAVFAGIAYFDTRKRQKKNLVEKVKEVLPDDDPRKVINDEFLADEGDDKLLEYVEGRIKPFVSKAAEGVTAILQKLFKIIKSLRIRGVHLSILYTQDIFNREMNSQPIDAKDSYIEKSKQLSRSLAINISFPEESNAENIKQLTDNSSAEK